MGMEMPKLKPLLWILETLVGGMKAALIGTALADTERYAIKFLLQFLLHRTIACLVPADNLICFVSGCYLSWRRRGSQMPSLQSCSLCWKIWASQRRLVCFAASMAALVVDRIVLWCSVPAACQAREEISVDELRFLATGSNLVACMARLTHEQYWACRFTLIFCHSSCALI